MSVDTIAVIAVLSFGAYIFGGMLWGEWFKRDLNADLKSVWRRITHQ